MSSGICGQGQPRSASASAQSDQGIHCPLTESLKTTKCMNEEQTDMIKMFASFARCSFFAMLLRLTLFYLGLMSLSTIFSHIKTMSGCDRELNIHFSESCITKKYQALDIWHDIPPSHIILTSSWPVFWFLALLFKCWAPSKRIANTFNPLYTDTRCNDKFIIMLIWLAQNFH